MANSTQWMSSDDKRNVLLDNIESRVSASEVLIEQLVKTQTMECNQVHQISKKLLVLTEHVQTLTTQLAQISLLLVHIAKNSTILVNQTVDKSEDEA